MRLLFEGGDYLQAATIRGRSLFKEIMYTYTSKDNYSVHVQCTHEDNTTTKIAGMM